MAVIHMMLQGKGGVGKSFISSLMAQFMKNKGKDILCVDTDPVNASFYGYKSLDVKRLEVMDGDEINTRKFDELIEWVSTATGDMVIDNGASSFIPLSSYLVSNDVPALIQSMGHKLVVHTVITGGQAHTETISGLETLLKFFPSETIFVVWLNPYWGAIVNQEGESFDKMPVYRKYKHRISAIIQLPELKKDTFGKDLSDMLQDHLTFDDVLLAEPIGNERKRGIMEKQRIKIIRDAIYGQLDHLELL